MSALLWFVGWLFVAASVAGLTGVTWYQRRRQAPGRHRAEGGQR